MTESRTISIRLEGADAKELDRRAATEGATMGLFAKRLLLDAIRREPAMSQAARPEIDSHTLAVQIAKHLRKDDLFHASKPDDQLPLLREIVIAVNRESKLSREAIDNLRKDLRELLRLLEEHDDDPGPTV